MSINSDKSNTDLRANDNLLRVFSNTRLWLCLCYKKQRFVSVTARFHFEALFNAGFKESDIIKQVLGLELLSAKRLQWGWCGNFNRGVLVLLMPTDKLVLSETVQRSDKLSLVHLAIPAFF